MAAGVCSGLGIAPQKIKEIIGITKAYCTRVGSGPFPTELDNEEGEHLRKLGNEYGATTGRPRRCGWIDLVALKFACMINGVTQIVMTKADVLDGFETLKACTSYKVEGNETTEVPFQMDKLGIEPALKEFKGWNANISAIRHAAFLPEEMSNYVQYINEYVGAPVKYVSNGCEREQIVCL
jgi:adenylosuccinate synthase